MSDVPDCIKYYRPPPIYPIPRERPKSTLLPFDPICYRDTLRRIAIRKAKEREAEEQKKKKELAEAVKRAFKQIMEGGSDV